MYKIIATPREGYTGCVAYCFFKTLHGAASVAKDPRMHHAGWVFKVRKMTPFESFDLKLAVPGLKIHTRKTIKREYTWYHYDNEKLVEE